MLLRNLTLTEWKKKEKKDKNKIGKMFFPLAAQRWLHLSCWKIHLEDFFAISIELQEFNF